MKKLVLQKVVTLVVALALGSACIANDAFARGGGDHRDNAHGFNCWKSQVVPTNAAWRLRQAQRGICY